MWQLETLLREMVSAEDPKAKVKSHTLTKAMIPRRYRTPVSKFFSLTSELFHENWRKVWIVTLWLGINVALFMWKYIEFEGSPTFKVVGYCVCFAKGFGETLKFNMALILLTVCRRTLTKLRSTFLHAIIPFDENINFHKLIALGIVIGSVAHTLFHLGCNYIKLSTCPKHKFMNALGPILNYQQPTYMGLLTSIVGLTGVFMCVIMAFSFTLATHSFRRNVVKLPWIFHNLAGFNAFWYAHHLLALAYVLLFMHGWFLIFKKPWYQRSVSTTQHLIYS